MSRLLGRLLVAWGLWKYIQGRAGQYLFGVTSLALVWYLSGEAEEYFRLTGQLDLLPALLIVKNVAYVIALIIFLAWSFLFTRSKGASVDYPEKDGRAEAPKASIPRETDDGFNKIRQRGKARSPSEIHLQKLGNKNRDASK